MSEMVFDKDDYLIIAELEKKLELAKKHAITKEDERCKTLEENKMSEYTEPEKLKLERVTVFQEGGAIYAKHLNAEFNNIIDYINSKFNVGEG
jgi:hypothetical protein